MSEQKYEGHIDYCRCQNCDNEFEPDNHDNWQIASCPNCSSNDIVGVVSTLLLTDARGIYIPKNFYEDFDLKAWGIDKNKFATLSNPDDEWYWEAWDELMLKAERKHGGLTYHLEQDGDLWARAYIEKE